MLNSSVDAALRQLGEVLGHYQLQWVVGGSCGILLQDVGLVSDPRDLDVYADESQIHLIHEVLKNYTIDAPSFSETDIYRSILSHYRLGEIVVELVGDFQIRSMESNYRVHISEGLLAYARTVRIGDVTIMLMPLAHELVFNVLRDRSDRYEAIAHTIRLDLDHHLPALTYILSNNVFHPSVLDKLDQLIGIRLDRAIAREP